MPEVDDVVGATLNYKLRVARGNVRKFLESATEGVQLGQYGEVVTKILAAVDEIEEKTGAPLDAANEQGWKTLAKKVEVRVTLLKGVLALVRGHNDEQDVIWPSKLFKSSDMRATLSQRASALVTGYREQDVYSHQRRSSQLTSNQSVFHCT